MVTRIANDAHDWILLKWSASSSPPFPPPSPHRKAPGPGGGQRGAASQHPAAGGRRPPFWRRRCHCKFMTWLFKTSVIYSQFSRDPSPALHHGLYESSQTARASLANTSVSAQFVVPLTLGGGRGRQRRLGGRDFHVFWVFFFNCSDVTRRISRCYTPSLDSWKEE